MNRNERLNEILDFDPETRERHEDRGNLTAIVPKEVQEIFIARFQRKRELRNQSLCPKEELIIPEKLLHIVDASNLFPLGAFNFMVERTYYAYTGEDTGEEDRRNWPFLVTSTIEFGSCENPNVIKIAQYGEHSVRVLKDVKTITIDSSLGLIILTQRLKDNSAGSKYVAGHVSVEEIIDKLINPLTLRDPVNAPPELDYSWRFADLLGTVGIK